MRSRHPHPALLKAFAVAAVLLLAGCEIPGIWPDPRIAQREEESKAIGGACRHALRGLEDCYTLNPKASKASVFAGWKEMDAYMRENEIVGMPFTPTPPAPPAEAGAEDGAHEPAADKGHGEAEAEAEADPNTKKTHKS